MQRASAHEQYTASTFPRENLFTSRLTSRSIPATIFASEIPRLSIYTSSRHVSTVFNIALHETRELYVQKISLINQLSRYLFFDSDRLKKERFQVEVNRY